MAKTLRTILRVAGIVILVCLAIVAGYIIYLQANYSRIADDTELSVETQQDTALKKNIDYTASTYNIGFGAYTPDYTFFMDEGKMEDGTPKKGTASRAVSEASVFMCTNGDIQTIDALHPDFALFQEVDTNSDRSWHVNQKEAIENAFSTMGSTYAVNFHSAYLAYPPTDPMGTANSGILTLSDARITSAVRRSYPIDESFLQKFFDLDRCFAVMRIPVEDGHELVLINSHMSAYDSGGTIRAKQLAMIGDVMEQEYAAGNYVIAGGDWNHALCGSETMYESDQQIPEWLHVMGDDDLPAGLSVVRASNIEEVATCRDDDIPYMKGITYTSTVDGFIVSDNVSASARNIDTGFAYSDHCPVLLTFQLKG